jgi:tetratricopeptide (TPR) repeat protein
MDVVTLTNREKAGSGQWSRLHLLLLGVILLTYVLISWQSIQAPIFVLDDAAEFAFVKFQTSWAALWQHDCFLFFRPVKNLCFLMFGALRPSGIETCRLLVTGIGLLSAVAVYALFRRLLRQPVACLAATACWLLAPTMVSCTAWLSCVNIQSMAGLAAVSLRLFLDARAGTKTSGTYSLAGAWLTSLLAMLCYEGAVCLPALFVLLDCFLCPEGLRTRRAWRTYAMLGSALLFYLLLRSLRGAVPQQIQSPNFGEMADWRVVIVAPWFFFQHLSIWLWPFGRQAILGGYVPGQVSPLLLGCAWLGVAALAAGCLWLRRRMAFAALGVAWCLVAFLPMSNILAFRNGPYGDYYLALASMGLALVFGWVTGVLAQRARLARGALLALVAIAIWRLAAVGESLVWAQAWNDRETILQRTLRTFPQAFSTINEYARLHYRRGAYDECQALTDRALAVAPHNRDSYELRALVAERRGNIALARKELDRFMQYGGTNESWGWYFQGHLLDEHLGDTNGAIRCYQQAVACRTGWSPEVLDSMCALAFFAAQRGDRREAIGLWEQVVQIDPGRKPVRQNLARAYLEAGDKAKAHAHWELLTKPQNIE